MKPSPAASLWLLFLLTSPPPTSAEAIRPANPQASAEARALLQVLYDISGTHTLSGQHNFPNTRARNTEFVKRHLGKTPAVYSQDWGFAAEGDKDSYLARPGIVEELIEQFRRGAIVTVCWHAVPPTADEPVVFRGPPPGPDAPGGDLHSVQGRLTDAQFEDLLTPGTALHDRWVRQVDTIAGFLQQLQDARVPVLWRPYHEMNGDWFWWGGRTGEHSTAALYRQLFDRLVNHHHLDNLVWVWSVDRPGESSLSFDDVYPGDDYMDVVSLDVYGRDFAQSYYDDLVALAGGKPLVLGEVGNPPTLEILEKQPLWAMYVVWAGMARGTSRDLYDSHLDSPRVLHLEDRAYWSAIAPLRQVAGLPGAWADHVHLDWAGDRVDFSGVWILDEESSDLGEGGAGMLPWILEINQDGDEMAVRRTFLSEYEDNSVTEETLRLDGTESRSDERGAPRVSTARWSDDGRSVVVGSTVTFPWGGGATVKSTERWELLDGGQGLSLRQSSTSPWGERSSTVVFERR